MSGLHSDWYVSGPDGEAVGPLTRQQLAEYQTRGSFGPEALAWHVDLAQWLPLSRVVVGWSAGTSPQPPRPERTETPPRRARDAPPPGPPDSAPKPPKRPPPKQGSPRPPAPASSAREAQQLRELRERLAASGAKVPDAASAAKSAEALTLIVRRALARLLDVVGLGVLGATVGWGLFEPTGVRPEPPQLLWAGLFALVLLEAIALATFGTTPGKALLGLRLADAQGARPGFGAAFGRARTVVWRGMGLGILPLTVLAAVIAGVQTLNQGAAPWDRSLGLQLRAATIDKARWQTAFALLLGGLFALAAGLWGELAASIADATRGVAP
jgi:hypothetical protein